MVFGGGRFGFGFRFVNLITTGHFLAVMFDGHACILNIAQETRRLPGGFIRHFDRN
jgi:hypothetical protein